MKKENLNIVTKIYLKETREKFSNKRNSDIFLKANNFKTPVFAKGENRRIILRRTLKAS